MSKRAPQNRIRATAGERDAVLVMVTVALVAQLGMAAPGRTPEL